MNAYDLTYQRYYDLLKRYSPDIPDGDIAKAARLLANDWQAHRDNGYVERSITEYDVFNNA